MLSKRDCRYTVLHSNTSVNSSHFDLGILNQTRTPAGARLLRQWLLRPSTSLDTIRQRHDAVECLVHPDNISVAEKMHKSIGGLKGGPLALTRLRKGKPTLQSWKAIVYVSLAGSVSAYAYVNLALGKFSNAPGFDPRAPPFDRDTCLTAGVTTWLVISTQTHSMRQLVKIIDDSTLIEVAEMIDNTVCLGHH
jgi:hypothetical protein